MFHKCFSVMSCSNVLLKMQWLVLFLHHVQCVLKDCLTCDQILENEDALNGHLVKLPFLEIWN